MSEEVLSELDLCKGSLIANREAKASGFGTWGREKPNSSLMYMTEVL